MQGRFAYRPCRCAVAIVAQRWTPRRAAAGRERGGGPRAAQGAAPTYRASALCPSATPGADDAACGQLGGPRSGRPAGRTVAARRRSARRWRWRWPLSLVLVAVRCACPLGRLLRITTRYARACHAHNQALCGDSGTIAAPQMPLAVASPASRCKSHRLTVCAGPRPVR